MHITTSSPTLKHHSLLKQGCLLFFVLIFGATILFPQQSVKASHGGNEHHPVTQAQAYAALNWWIKCDETEGLTDDSRTEEQMNTARVFNQPFGTQDPKQLGYVFSDSNVDVNDEGFMPCSNGRGGPLLEAIGIDPLTFLTTDTGIYRFDEDEGAYVRTGTSTRQDIRDAFSEYFPDVNFGQNMSTPMLYFAYLETFRANCIREENTTNGTEISVVDQAGNITTETHVMETGNDAYLVGYGVPSPAVTINDADYLRCTQLRDRINEHAQTVAAAISDLELDDDAIPDAPDDDAAADDTQSCEELSGVMGWLLCPIILAVDNGLEFVDREIQRLLIVDRTAYEDPGIQAAWTIIRNIAYSFLLPITLVMVITTALGFDLVSAYTVKRALPRLVIAALFIGLSYQICVSLIEVSNEVGQGVLGLLSYAFSSAGGGSVDTLSLADLFAAPSTGGGQILGSIFGIGQAIAFGVGLGVFLWLYGSVLLLAIATGFIVLLARQLFLIALLLLAPLAILAWIFPGNDKLWKAWWSLFSKLLMMFPLIMGLIVLGRIFAFILNTGGGGEGGLQGAIINPIAKLTVYVLPYAFIPLTYKFAGGVFSMITGFVSDQGQGLLGKRMAERRAQKVQDFTSGKSKGPILNNRFARRIGEGLGVGMSAGIGGAFGFGRRGRSARGLRSAALIEQTRKANPLLDQLANNDDANAVLGLSGGNRSGAEEAARDLFTTYDEDGNAHYDEARAQSALAAAAAVGFTSANARVAWQTMAQNKSRAVAAGRVDILQRGLERMSGANPEMATGMGYEYAFYSRQAGRLDLGGVWHSQAAQEGAEQLAARTGTTAQEALSHITMTDGLGRSDISGVVRGHTNQVRQATRSVEFMFDHGDDEQRVTAARRVLELQGALPYATGENQNVINEMMANLGIQRDATRTVTDEAGRTVEQRVSVAEQLAEALNRAAPGEPPITAAELSAGARSFDREEPRRAGMRPDEE